MMFWGSIRVVDNWMETIGFWVLGLMFSCSFCLVPTRQVSIKW